MCLTAAGGAASRRSKPGAGFTLVEVLVAAVVTGVILAASYGWLWSVAASCATDRRPGPGDDARRRGGTWDRGRRPRLHRCGAASGRQRRRALSGARSPPPGDGARESADRLGCGPSRGVAKRIWNLHRGSRRLVSSPVPPARRSGDPGSRDDRRRLDGRHGGLRRTGGERRLCRREPAVRDLGGRVVKARRAASGGYAMLAALLIMALAGTFALVVVGAVCSLQAVEGADAAGRRASSAEADALSAVTRSLRWRPAETTGSAVADDPSSRESWQVAWSPCPAAPADVWPRVAVKVARRSGDPGSRDDRRRVDDRHGGLRRTGGERRLCRRGPAVRDLGGRVVKARRAASGGYAMLAALLIMALAGTFALVVVGAVCSLQAVEGADAAGRRASSIEADALSAVARSLRWRPAETTGSAAADDPPSKESWQAAWSPFPAAPGDVWPRVAVHVATTARRANRRDDLVLDLRSEPWAMGVTCAADAEIGAPLTVSGSGVYVGGCLTGRENVAFVPAPGSPDLGGAPPDGVRGDVFPAAAVHAGAGIFAGGAEIHESAGTEGYVDDTDRHVGEAASPDWLSGPSAEVLLAARAEASPPGAALVDGLLRLDDLPAAVGSDLTGGRCLLLPPADQVAIEGSAARCRPPADHCAGGRAPRPSGRDAHALRGAGRDRSCRSARGGGHRGHIALRQSRRRRASEHHRVALLARFSPSRSGAAHSRGGWVNREDERVGGRTLCTQYSHCERLTFL